MAMNLKINQNDNGSFTVEWDKKDPDWMFLNQLTSEQIQDMISEVTVSYTHLTLPTPPYV